MGRLGLVTLVAVAVAIASPPEAAAAQDAAPPSTGAVFDDAAESDGTRRDAPGGAPEDEPAPEASAPIDGAAETPVAETTSAALVVTTPPAGPILPLDGAAPPAPGDDGLVTVHLRSESPDHTPTLFHRDAGGWRPICRLPCDRRVHVGEAALGLRAEGASGDPTPIDGETVLIEEESEILFEHVDRRGGRVGGAFLLVLGALLYGLGAGMLAAWDAWEPSGWLDFGGTAFLLVSIIGFAGGTASSVAGFVLAAHGDTARARVELPYSIAVGLR